MIRAALLALALLTAVVGSAILTSHVASACQYDQVHSS